MGTTDISSAKNSGDTQDESWYNDFRSVLLGAVVGRDPSSGAVASGQDIGSAVTPWGALYATSLVIGGATVDLGNLTGEANAILSGKTISTSIRPDFLRASGAAATVTVEGATTSLVLNIDGTSTTISTDLAETGLTVAPSTNNTCLVNDTSLTGQESSKWQGEDGTTLLIDTAGSEITSRVGQYAVFKTSTEYMLAYIESATELTNIYRGYFLDSSGSPLERVALSNNDTLTIMSAGWVFVEDDALTVDVTYTSPVYDIAEPSSPATGDYWFDLVAGKWKRYGGASFAEVNRIPVGIAVINATNCVASRSFDLTKAYVASNPVNAKYISTTVLSANEFDFDINVYGTIVNTRHTEFEWDIATDLESGVTEGASTTYFAYITEEGEAVLSDKKPYDLRGILKGWYHPYNSWRAVGYIENDGSSDFESTTLFNYYDENVLNMNEQGISNLRAMDALVPSADKIFYYTSGIATALTSLTSFGRSLIDDASASAARSTLGLGDIATLNQSDFRSTGTSGSFSGSGTATLTATIPTGYTKVICMLQDVRAASGTGSSAMTFAVSDDSGSTWSAEFSLGSEGGGAGAFRCTGQIEIGLKASSDHQYLHYFTYDTGATGSGDNNWTGVAPTVKAHGFGTTGSINRVRLSVTGLTGSMSAGTIKYLAIK